MGRPAKKPEHALGLKIRELRQSLKLNQSQFAVIWGVDRADISRYELYLTPSKRLINRLNLKFNIDLLNQNQLPVQSQQPIAA